MDGSAGSVKNNTLYNFQSGISKKFIKMELFLLEKLR